MNKIEFYNKMINIYKSTGQGVPKFIADRAGDDIVDELVKDGLVKIVVNRFNHLSDDITICLTKGYCVEDYTSNHDTSALTFLRIYLNHDPVIELGEFRVSLRDAIRNPDYMTGYSEWLLKNKEKLDEGEKIEFLDETDVAELSDETIEYLKTRRWYKEDETILDCIKSMNDGDTDIDKELKIYDELIMLKTSASVRDKYQEEVKEDIKNRDELKTSKRIRNRIRNWLENKDPKLKIQSLI